MRIKWSGSLTLLCRLGVELLQSFILSLNAVVMAMPDRRGKTAAEGRGHLEDHEMEVEEDMELAELEPNGFFADADDLACAVSVRVALRVRPLVGKELFERQGTCVDCNSKNSQVIIGKDRQFTFDKVFSSQESQNSVFLGCVKNLVLGCFQGYNATVLAYGQTGSGKTFTMGSGYSLGVADEDLGIIPRVIKLIFSEVAARKNKAEFIIKCSFLEIYNEELHDLLDSTPSLLPQSKNISIREEKNGTISVYGLKEVTVKDSSEMEECLDLGSTCRITGSTAMNEQSSRSHAIFTITIEQHLIEDLLLNQPVADASDKPDEFMVAKFHFVDLAGSERAKRTGATGTTLKEGININMSLLALGNVISALTDEKKGGAGHIPYRDSKLTRILQDSLGGNSRTTMIACCSPAEKNFEETLNTLKYAQRARNIKNTPVVNRDPHSLLIAQLRQQVFELGKELLSFRKLLIGNNIEFESHVQLPHESTLDTLGQAIQSTQIAFPSNAPTTAEIKHLEFQVADLKREHAKLEKESRSSQSAFEILQEQHAQMSIDSFSFQKERDTARFQLETIVKALKKRNLFEEIVLEINQGVKPDSTDLNQVMESVFGNSGLCILEEYQVKVEEQKTEIDVLSRQLKALQTDNQQLIEAAAHDTQNLEAKELEVQKLKRSLTTVQKDTQRGTMQKKNQSVRIPVVDKLSARNMPNLLLGQPAFDQNQPWMSSELDNRIKHFDEINKLFIEDLTNEMSRLIVQTERGRETSPEKAHETKFEEEAGLSDESDSVDEDGTLLDIPDQEVVLQQKELQAKLETQETLMVNIDGMVKSKEQLLEKFKMGQKELQDNLLLAMKEEYHKRIQQMNEELLRLENVKNNQLKQANGVSAKNKIEDQYKQQKKELEGKLQELKQKEKEQLAMKKTPSQNLVHIKSLEQEIERMRTNKVSLMKKIKEESDSFNKWKKERQTEVLTLRKQILKKDRENDALKREFQKKDLVAKRKQEEVYALQNRQKLDQQKRQNATKQRQQAKNVDTHKIREWILENTTRMVEFRNLQVEKQKESQFCRELDAQISDIQKQCAKYSVQAEKLEQRKARLQQAFSDDQDGQIEQIEADLQSLTAFMTNSREQIDSLEDNQRFVNEKIAQCENSMIALKPGSVDSLVFADVQTLEGARACLTIFFTICLETKIQVQDLATALQSRESDLNAVASMVQELQKELMTSELQYKRMLAQLKSQFAESEKLSVRFIVEKVGMDIVESLFSATKVATGNISLFEVLDALFKQKLIQVSGDSDLPGAQKEQFRKAQNAKAEVQEGKKQVVEQTKAALSKQVAELERKLKESEMQNKRLKNDILVAREDKFKYKQMLENETAKLRKVQQSFGPEDNLLLPLTQTQPFQPAHRNLKEEREKRKLRKAEISNQRDAEDLLDEQGDDQTDVFSRLVKKPGSSFNHSRGKDLDLGSSGRYSDTREDGDDSRNWELAVDKHDAHKSPILSMLSINNQLWTAASKSLKVWDVETMSQLSDISEKIGFIKAMTFWKERNMILTATEKAIMMWDVVSLTNVDSIKITTDIRSLQIVPETSLLFAGGKASQNEGSLLIFDLRKSNEKLIAQREKSAEIFSLAATPNTVFFGCRNHEVRPFCLKLSATGNPLKPPHFDVVTSLALLRSSNGVVQTLVSGSRDKNLRCYDATSFDFCEQEAIMGAHNDQINTKETDFTQTSLYSGSKDGVVKVWKKQPSLLAGKSELKCQAELYGNAQRQPVNCITKLDDSNTQGFACGSQDRSIRIFKYHPNEQPMVQEQNYFQVASKDDEEVKMGNSFAEGVSTGALSQLRARKKMKQQQMQSETQ